MSLEPMITHIHIELALHMETLEVYSYDPGTTFSSPTHFYLTPCPNLVIRSLYIEYKVKSLPASSLV